MKKFNKIFAVCVSFVFFALSFSACNKNDNLSKSSAKQITESFAVEASSDVAINYDDDNFDYESDGKIYIEKDATITATAKDLSQNPNKTYLELGYIPTIVVNNKAVNINSEIIVSKDLNINIQKTYIKLAGVAIYQNHPANSEFDTVTNPLDFVTNNISVSANSISTTNPFIVAASFGDNMHIASNTRSFVSNSSNHLTVGLEVLYETTKTYSVLILKDSFGRVYYQPVGMNKLKSNSTNMVYEYSLNLTPNTLSSTQKFTLILSNNLSTKK